VNTEAYIGFAALCLVLYLAVVKWIERRRAAELSLAGAGREFSAGVLTGLALFSLIITILWTTGAYQLQGWGGSNALGLAVMVFWFAVAVEEEILFRGLLCRLCAKAGASTHLVTVLPRCSSLSASRSLNQRPQR
jgi:uncharacterized protein